MDLEDFQLKVYYPYGGKHYMLHCHTNDTQGVVLLAKSKAALDLVANRFLLKNDDATIKSAWIIEMVSPSDELVETARLDQIKSDIYLFKMDVTFRLKSLMDSGKSLPTQFEECISYESYSEDSDYTPDEWSIEKHYGCKNCSDKIRFVKLTAEDLYYKYNKSWREIFPHLPYKNKLLRVSQAVKANDGEKFWCAIGGGVTLNAVDAAIINLNLDDTLFYYRQIEELNIDSYNQELANIKDEYKKQFAERSIRDRIYRENKNQLEIAKVLSIFAE